MDAVQIAFVVFAVLGVASFAVLRPATAVMLCILGGWAVLPVGVYPTATPDRPADAVFPYWIIGIGLPSEMLLTKAWVSPVVAFVGVLVFDRRSLLALRPRWVDVPIVLWCLSPLAAFLVGKPTSPAAWVSVIYLTGSWGLTWILGRAHFDGSEGLRQLAGGVVWAGLAYVPVAVLEGVWGPRVYGWVYALHPYRLDGAERYVGYRPVGFLEHGNQYGMWMAGAALIAVVLAVSRGRRRWDWVSAGVLVLAAVASQSVGAILLLGVGLVCLGAMRVVSARVLVLGIAGAVMLGLAVYATSLTPLRTVAMSHPVGQRVVQVLRNAGRHSLAWRLSLDERHLRHASQDWMTGSGRWDWWDRRDGPSGRPWGLWQLILGQYGAVAVLAAAGVWSVGALRRFWHRPRDVTGAYGATGAHEALAALLLITMADAVLNSFVLLPMLLAAGGLAAGLPFRERKAVVSASAAGYGVGVAAHHRS